VRGLILALAMLVAGAAAAQTVRDGFEAYLRRDYDTAVRIWKPLAEKGILAAQYTLGLMYDNGEGVPEDNIEAAKWYRLVAEQGDVDAQYSLGLMYAKGEGVPRDYVQAYKWWSLAATKGEERSRRDKEKISKLMSREQIAEAQRLSREWRPK
jgi:TPR repeat protein